MIVGSRMVAKTGQKLRHLFVDAEGAEPERYLFMPGFL